MTRRHTCVTLALLTASAWGLNTICGNAVAGLSRRAAVLGASSALVAFPYLARSADTPPAISAQRFSVSPVLTPVYNKFLRDTRTLCEDELIAPKGNSKRAGSLKVSFIFPTDWAQLDRALGGIQYVDQNTGAKLYVLRAPLPEGSTLETVPKSFFGNAIFSPEGTIQRGGTGIDGYKVTSSKLIEAPEGACSQTRRRLGIKYTAVSGNQLLVERRALADVYEAAGYAYIMLASATASKWDAKEEKVAESIVDSFFIGAPVY